MNKRNSILSVLLIVQVSIVNIFSRFPHLIEKYYSNGIYPYIASFFRILLGWIPFSVGDILLFITFIWLLRSLWKFIKQSPKNYKKVLLSIGAKLSVLYFFFYLFWGMNYYRIPLHESMDLTIPEYSIEELSILAEKLLVETQEIHFKLTRNDTIPVSTVLSQRELMDRTALGYGVIAEKYPQFEYKYPKVKKSLFSLPMSFMGFGGYLNPLTGESQVNYNLENYSIPATASHEVAHQIGYANESEANFIGCLAAINSSDSLFQYSGYLMALRYTLGEIYQSDKERHREISNRLPIGVQKNIDQSRAQWRKYENPFEPVFKKIYDLFLKANLQEQGMKSYGKMVGLLMAIENKEHADFYKIAPIKKTHK